MAKMLNVRLEDREMDRLDRNASLPIIAGDRSRYTRLALRWFHRGIEGADGRQFLADALLDDETEMTEGAQAA